MKILMFLQWNKFIYENKKYLFIQVILHILALSASTPSQRRKKEAFGTGGQKVLEGPIPKNMTPQNKTFEWVNSYVFSPLKYSPNRFILTPGISNLSVFLTNFTVTTTL